jgi:hypothetical protein
MHERDKHTSLFNPFISYEENKVLWIRPLGPYSQLYIFFVAYEWAKQARVLHWTRVEMLAMDKHRSLLRSYVWSVVDTAPGHLKSIYMINAYCIVSLKNL